MRLLDKEESGRRASDEDKKLPFGARLEIGKEEGGRKKTPYVFARPYWPLAQRTSAMILAAVTSAAVNSAAVTYWPRAQRTSTVILAAVTSAAVTSAAMTCL